MSCVRTYPFLRSPNNQSSSSGLFVGPEDSGSDKENDADRYCRTEYRKLNNLVTIRILTIIYFSEWLNRIIECDGWSIIIIIYLSGWLNRLIEYDGWRYN